MINIIKTSAGRRVALLCSLQDDARMLGKEANLLAVDFEPALSAACASADLSDIARQIVKVIPGLRDPFCFQAILTAEGPTVFEINARFGGGYPLAPAAGATFGKWLIEESLGLPSTANDEWQDGFLILRYDAAVFIKNQ